MICFWPNRRQCQLYSNSHSFWLISFAIYESFTLTRTHLAAWLGLETVIMCAAHSTRTLDSQYVTNSAGVLPRCHCPFKKSFTILRTACVHCPLSGSVRLVLVPIHWGALSLEPRAISMLHQLARKFLLWLCMCCILLSIC